MFVHVAFRKHVLKCISYSRDHMMRTYPGAMRLDSSNFNPIQYWAFGMQMVALNFQTPDISLAINTAMFEQTGNCGFMLKPRSHWDLSDQLYQRFNPLSKDDESSCARLLSLDVGLLCLATNVFCPLQSSFTSL
ncbi:hypothetical protein AB6A40_007693 [Gnathostoma spinigerum]|uniref:Phosphoinositide phospholipase C n=1 Tax=Gnathostoma spinigerum TaxID=75299 RepID=A0ABD6ELZ9_9BILA